MLCKPQPGHCGAAQGGEDVDGGVLARQVVDLLATLPACQGRCLVWAKSDALVAAVKQLAPLMPVGYVVLNETAQVGRP